MIPSSRTSAWGALLQTAHAPAADLHPRGAGTEPGNPAGAGAAPGAPTAGLGLPSSSTQQAATRRSRTATQGTLPWAIPVPAEGPAGRRPRQRRRCQGGARPGLEGRPSSPHPAPQSLQALLLCSRADRHPQDSRGGNGGGWEVGASSRVPVPRCPPLTALPRGCEDTVARLRVRTSEALGTDVPDARGSEYTLGGLGVSARSHPQRAGFSRKSASVGGRPRRGTRRS